MDIFNNLPLLTEFPTRKHWEAAVWEILIERLATLKSPAELKKALHFLLSPRERHNATFRALVASRTKSGIGFREIGREVWLSSDTISAIRKSLGETDYKSARARGHVKRKYAREKSSPREQYPRRFSAIKGRMPG